jgi:putative pyoverdin transport system ATP-binding/permease protein
MYLYNVLFKKHPGKIFYFSLLGLITGFVNALLFMYINRIITIIIGNEEIELNWHIFSYLFIIWLFVFSRRFLSLSIINFTQNNLYNFKSGLISLIIRSDYSAVNKRKDTIYNVLTRDIEQISEAGNVLTNLVSSIILVLGCLGYIAFVSWKLFFISLVIIVAGVLTYRLSMKRIVGTFNKVKDLNDQFVQYLHQIISGFKEIKVAKEKGIDIENNYVKPNLSHYHSIVVKTYSGFMNAQNVGMLLFYLAIGFMLIMGGSFLHVRKEALVTFIFILLFINGPIQSIILLLPVIGEANVSSKRLDDLHAALEKDVQKAAEDFLSSPPTPDFQNISVKNMQFRHQSEEAQFEIGPISLEINKGQIYFIHGGNGSGKTTFMMCLLGIYTHNSGEISVNGNTKDEHYSSLFSPVFSDFFLFDKFYGNPGFDPRKAQSYIELFELESKVSITDNRFSTIKLSMGQRKRLALIQALLENKPVIVLDEWAADQDPHFREKFYKQILPLIKSEGKTVIAITHDDKYFSTADHLFKMEEGKLIQQN